jgi:RNA polymerase sigma-70 factor (ECF subfamily)
VEHGDDLKLAERMLGGDEEAFGRFAERFFRPLLRFALGRLGDRPDLARELVQSAVCKALAKLDGYRGEASMLTWLCSICRNEMLMHFRSEKTARTEIGLGDEQEPGSPAAVLPFPGGDPEAALAERDAAWRVHAALDALPGHYARALEWKYVERWPVARIAGELGQSEKAAESLLTRARGAFRQSYEALAADLTAGPRVGPESGSGGGGRLAEGGG